MNSVRTGTFRSFLLVAIASWVVDGHAWAQTMPSPVMPPATPQPPGLTGPPPGEAQPSSRAAASPINGDPTGRRRPIA